MLASRQNISFIQSRGTGRQLYHMAHEPFIEPFFIGNSQLWRTIEYCRLEYVVKERDFVDFFTKFSDCRAISLPFLAATAF